MVEKTLIGILASHDEPSVNNALSKLLDELHRANSALLAQFWFVFTGGTYDRIIKGSDSRVMPVAPETKAFLEAQCGVTRLPSRSEGGVTVLSYLVVSQICSIIWAFLTPLTSHWLNPENLALMRLSDQWHAKRLMNSGSVREWFSEEASHDVNRNRQSTPPKPVLKEKETLPNPAEGEIAASITAGTHAPPRMVSDMTIALIAHDGMKKRMVEFAIDHERDLSQFKRILSTGGTGREVIANTRALNDLVVRYQSGPKGGDIEIATEILRGDCHAVVFFVDPLNPHPHIEDIRVVFGACMIRDDVRMLTNEMSAREWMQRVVRPSRGTRPQVIGSDGLPQSV